MANISMKFVLLVAVVAVLCSVSSGFRDRNSRPRPSGGFGYPGTPPFNPGSRGGLPDAYKNVRFRREAAAIEPTLDGAYYPVNDAAELDEIVRHAREAGDTVYVVDEPEYYNTN